MAEYYECVTFHTPACDEHQDCIVNFSGPDGLDDECPICALEAAQAEIGRLLKVKVAANQLRIRQTRDHIEVQIGDWNKLCEALAATGEKDND